MIHLLFAFLREHAGYLIDPFYLPGLAVLASVFLVLDVAAVCLTLIVHERRLLRCRREYVEAVEEKHRRTLEFQARQAVKEILDGLVGTGGIDEAGESPRRSERLGKPQRFNEQTIRAVREPFFNPSSTIMRSVLDQLKLSQDYAYKAGAQYNPPEEMKDFIREGFLGGAAVTTDRLTQRLLNFSRKGFPNLREIRVDDLVMKNTDENRRRQLFNDLRDRSALFFKVRAQ